MDDQIVPARFLQASFVYYKNYISMRGLVYILVGLLSVIIVSCNKVDKEDLPKTGTAADIDGNVYNTISIGSQVWMVENLHTTRYNDGELIPNISDNIDWITLTTGAYCAYKNSTDTDSIDTFGYLYNWFAVNTGKLAPKGWHIPTHNDWNELTDFLKGAEHAGAKLKEEGTDHWIYPNGFATNSVDFNALPAGDRNAFDGTFDNMGWSTNWWASTEESSTNAYYRAVRVDYPDLLVSYFPINAGFSIRCIRD